MSSASKFGFFLTLVTILLTHDTETRCSLATDETDDSFASTSWTIWIFSDNSIFFFVRDFYRWLIGGISLNSDGFNWSSSNGLPEPLFLIFYPALLTSFTLSELMAYEDLEYSLAHSRNMLLSSVALLPKDFSSRFGSSLDSSLWSS